MSDAESSKTLSFNLFTFISASVIKFAFLSVIIVAVLLVADGKPFKRGFFCGDESLMMPYRDSTVRTKYLIMAMGLPMAVIVIVEMTRSTFNIQENSKLKLFNRDFPDVALNVLKHIGYYLFGLAVTVITTDIGKQMLGRLRPHFMEVCQPIMSDGTNCSSSLNFNRYIQDYTCGNEKTSPHILKQMKLSFPSGHASLSVFISLFTTFYLQHRMNWAGSKFLKPILQLALILSALFTSLSRISDYKHHCESIYAK